MVSMCFGIRCFNRTLAMATGAQFVREIFTGVYGSDFGLWNTNAGEVVRHQHAIGANHVRLFYNIVPEATAYLGNRNIADIAASTVFNARPDALCVSGLYCRFRNIRSDLEIGQGCCTRYSNIRKYWCAAGKRGSAIVGSRWSNNRHCFQEKR